MLLEIGAMCVKLGRHEQAEQIIRGVKGFRDDVPHPSSVLGFALLAQQRLQEAATELETCLSAFPNHQLGKALLALVYKEDGRQDWESLLEEVIEDGRDVWAVDLARQSLGPQHRSTSASAQALARPAPSMVPGSSYA